MGRYYADRRCQGLKHKNQLVASSRTHADHYLIQVYTTHTQIHIQGICLCGVEIPANSLGS